MNYGYFVYADKIMRDHEEYERYKTELNKYKLYDILEGDNIINRISEIVTKMVEETENIDKYIIEQRYLEYIGLFIDNSVEIDHDYIEITYIKCKLPDLTHSYKCNNIDIPFNIFIYCLCLGIKIEKIQYYRNSKSSEFNS